MATNLTERAAAVISSDRRLRPTMAKADLRKAENWLHIGQAIDRVRSMHHLSLKEFADALSTDDQPRDERQVAKWIEGKERPQLDVVFAVPTFRASVVIALAEMAGADIEVTTHISVRRTA
jgi:DNA-binding transcriptional regulator YiaG